MTSPSVRRRRICRTAAPGAAALLVLAGCSATDGSSAGSSSGGAGPGGELSGTVTVFAAASLEESFTALGEAFEEAHPGTEVTFNFGGSDALAAGVANGAPADVFAAASPKTMATVTAAGETKGAPVTFVRNRLQIATPRGNPEHISSLDDLAASGLKVVLCDRQVPCGAAAAKALDAGGVDLTPASYEQDVKSALTKVVLKEADAALVYRTDVRAADGKVTGVDFPESAGAVNDYPIALLEHAPNSAAARAFIELVRGSEGQKVLTAAGFLKP